MEYAPPGCTVMAMPVEDLEMVVGDGLGIAFDGPVSQLERSNTAKRNTKKSFVDDTSFKAFTRNTSPQKNA